MSASIRREVIIRLCARFFENKTLAQRSESFIKKTLASSSSRSTFRKLRMAASHCKMYNNHGHFSDFQEICKENL